MIIEFDITYPYVCINSRMDKYENLQYAFDSDVAYEVLRVMNGRPLFLREHFARLIDSLSGMGVDTSAEGVRERLDSLESDIVRVMEANSIENRNIKVLAGNFRDGRMDVIVHINPTFYPPEVFYREGVDTLSVKAERKNPNLKVINSELNDRIKDLKDETGIYEAILVDHDGFITEGSKSNIFFVKGDKLITPEVSHVLPGITRQMVMRVAGERGIECQERDVPLAEIGDMDASFLTGTSLHILPIRKIDGVEYDSPGNPVVMRLAEGLAKKTEGSEA